MTGEEAHSDGRRRCLARMGRARTGGAAGAVVVAAAVIGAGTLAARAAGRHAAASEGAAMFPYAAATFAWGCDRDPSSPVRALVYDYQKRQRVPGGIRSCRGPVDLLGYAFTASVVRMEAQVPLEQETTEVDDGSVERAFRGWIGRDLRRADGRLDARTIEAAFDRVYVRPNDQLAPSLPARIVYDTLFRQWLARYAASVAAVLDHDDLLARKARELTVRQGHRDFDGLAFQTAATEAMGLAQTVSSRDVGTLIRRAADGSLPALLKILRRVLADYDPETSARLDAQLRVARHR
jgi:hypothetical protein